ncbi:MAG TPA: choice-of-anchor D domain-containing protein [Candidatus Acidoferrum sp.]
MAQHVPLSALPLAVRRNRVACCRSLPHFILLAAIFLFPAATLLPAQTPAQQFVFTSAPTTSGPSTLNASLKNPQSGMLTAAAGSPFADKLASKQIAVDALGRFLFAINPATNNISMFAIDPATGALTEVPASPFAMGQTLTFNTPPTNPSSLVTEKSGQFLYVAYANNTINGKGFGEVDAFSIDAVHAQLVPSATAFAPTTSGAIALATDTKGRNLYAYLGFLDNSLSPNSELQSFSIDTTTGNLTQLDVGLSPGEHARSLAIDPQDRFVFAGQGDTQGQLEAFQISPVDGSLFSATAVTALNSAEFPDVIAVDSSGNFLYVATSQSLHIFSIDATTGALTEVSGSPQQITLGSQFVTDPAGPFLYGANFRGFQIDPQTGLLTELPGSPFLGSGTFIAISANPVQAVVGPVAAFFPTSKDFGSVALGAASSTQIIQIVSNGGQAMTLNSVAISGANASDFTQTNTCQPPTVLAPERNCSVSITFRPTATGLRQAALTITDDAPGSPQSAPLTGTGISQQSGVTLSAGSVTFATITQGTTVAAPAVTLTSAGTATLHITSVTLGGANPSDFAMTTTCSNAAFAPNATCAVNATFAPLAAGLRSATITISDNAPDSPQIVALAGTANPAIVVAAPANASMAASISPGQTAMFPLQLTPGSGFTGQVAFTCTGAPPNAACTVPAVQVASGGAVSFTVMVTTSGNGSVAPLSFPQNQKPLPRIPVFLFELAALCAFFLVFAGRSIFFTRYVRPALAALGLIVAVGIAGCSGGAASAPSVAQVVVTPRGTFAIAVTPTVITTGGKQLAPLPAIQLTLTVN